MATLVSPDAARPPGAPHRGVVVVQHVLLVAGAHSRLLLALQHLTVPAVLHVVLRLREYQLPSLNNSYTREQSVQKKGQLFSCGHEDLMKYSTVLPQNAEKLYAKKMSNPMPFCVSKH